MVSVVRLFERDCESRSARHLTYLLQLIAVTSHGILILSQGNIKFPQLLSLQHVLLEFIESLLLIHPTQFILQIDFALLDFRTCLIAGATLIALVHIFTVVITEAALFFAVFNDLIELIVLLWADFPQLYFYRRLHLFLTLSSFECLSKPCLFYAALNCDKYHVPHVE